MRRLRYGITTLAPVVLSAGSGDANMVGTFQHIPGGTALGATAARFLFQNGIDSRSACHDERFYNFFLKGSIRFGAAFIKLTDEDGETFVHFPTPWSIRREKRGDSIFDLLRTDDEDEEPEEQTKSAGGYCRLDESGISFAAVETGFSFHHARDPETGTSKKEQIFNYESIAPGQTFQGEIRGDSEMLKALADSCGNAWTGHIGRSKNSQYGKIRFQFIDKTPQPLPAPEISKGETPLTLVSDTIIYNDNGFSTTDRDSMERCLGLTIKKCFVRRGDVETFVSVRRMKTPSEACFKAGSCFLIETPDEEAISRLAGFQETGIGERTHEGYGQCVPGVQTETEPTERKLKPPRIPRPDGPVPETAKSIIKTLIRDAVRKEVELEAMREMQEFDRCKSLSTSLIGRLGAMVRGADQAEFIKRVGDLRRIASDNLKKCRNRSQDLREFLLNKRVTAAAVLKNPQLSGLQGLCEEIGYEPENDADFETELYQTYFTAFFSAMRKTVKRSRGGDG